MAEGEPLPLTDGGSLRVLQVSEHYQHIPFQAAMSISAAMGGSPPKAPRLSRCVQPLLL